MLDREERTEQYWVTRHKVVSYAVKGVLHENDNIRADTRSNDIIAQEVMCRRKALSLYMSNDRDGYSLFLNVKNTVGRLGFPVIPWRDKIVFTKIEHGQ